MKCGGAGQKAEKDNARDNKAAEKRREASDTARLFAAAGTLHPAGDEVQRLMAGMLPRNAYSIAGLHIEGMRAL